MATSFQTKGVTNPAARTAHADQLHAEVRDARNCDALDPCADCKTTAAEVRAARKDARVEALTRADAEGAMA